LSWSFLLSSVGLANLANFILLSSFPIVKHVVHHPQWDQDLQLGTYVPDILYPIQFKPAGKAKPREH